MANIKHTAEERQDFHARLNKIYDLIPADFIKRVLKKLPDVLPARIFNVRYGRVVDFEILEILEDLASEVHDKITK